MTPIELIEFGQKLVDTKSLVLLLDGFNLDGTWLDLYGSINGGECLVEDVAIANTRVSIYDLLSSVQVAYLDSVCNKDRPSGKERRQDEKAEAEEMHHG